MLDKQKKLSEELYSKSYVEHEEIEGKISHLKSLQLESLNFNSKIGSIIGEPYKKIKRRVKKYIRFLKFPVNN